MRMVSGWRLQWPWYKRTDFSSNEGIMDVLGIDYEHQFIKKATIVLEASEAPMVTLEVYVGNNITTEEKRFELVPVGEGKKDEELDTDVVPQDGTPA